MQTIQPLYDNIIFEPIEVEETTSGGIILSDSAEKKNIQRGKVIAVGNGRKTDYYDLSPLTVSIGDTIIVTKYGGIDLGNNQFLVKEDHVLAIIK